MIAAQQVKYTFDNTASCQLVKFHYVIGTTVFVEVLMAGERGKDRVSFCDYGRLLSPDDR